MGNTSSVRVHFPASYVRLPECNRYVHNLHPHKTVGLKRHRFLHSLTASIIMTLPQLHYTSFPTLDVAQRDRNDLAMTAMTHDGFPWDGLVYLPIHECVDFLWVHVGKYAWMLWVSVFFFFIYFFFRSGQLKRTTKIWANPWRWFVREPKIRDIPKEIMHNDKNSTSSKVLIKKLLLTFLFWGFPYSNSSCEVSICHANHGYDGMPVSKLGDGKE